jgi:L-lactate utilization protein LutB
MQPVSGQKLGKHIPAEMNTNVTSEEWCLLCGQCQEVMATTVEAMNQLSSAREAEKRWCYN